MPDAPPSTPPPPPPQPIGYYSAPVPAPSPRPTAVTVLAIIAIAWGAMGAVCSPFALIPYFVQFGPPNPMIDAMKNDPVIFRWLIGSMAVHWPLSVLLLACGIGALNLKAWARMGLIYWSVIVLVTK